MVTDIEITDPAIIHPKWPIEEYARRARRCVWFRPPRPPIKVLMMAIVIIILFDKGEVIEIIINSGAIFCHVARIAQLIHLILDIIWGSQKWKGAAPIFTISAKINIYIIKLGEKIE